MGAVVNGIAGMGLDRRKRLFIENHQDLEAIPRSVVRAREYWKLCSAITARIVDLLRPRNSLHLWVCQ